MKKCFNWVLLVAGAEYTHDLDEEGINMAYLYGVGKIPIAFPFMRGAVRAGYSMPMGDAGDMI